MAPLTRHTMTKFLNRIVLLLSLVPVCSYAAVPIVPASDDEVVEVLANITRQRPNATVSAQQSASPLEAAAAARESIALARQTGETRYWGHAQAALGPWWNRATAPVELAVLQATVQQGRHEFDAARAVLLLALKRDPSHAQGWLTLASLNRLSARYAETLQACDAVGRAGQPMYAQACRLETLSMQGQYTIASQGMQALLAQSVSGEQQSWIWSLQAENLERAGQDKAASNAYQRSLALVPDLYTAIAYSDLLLRTGAARQALGVLASAPETDAVLLRRATAWKRMADPRWKAARITLQERKAELLRRGDDPLLHGRELALVALWLDDDPAQAVTMARSNLMLQREPLDYWVALQSAKRANDSAAMVEFSRAIVAVGLKDQRLLQLQSLAPKTNSAAPSESRS